MVVALHFVVKDFGLARGGRRDQVLLQDAQNVRANVLELLLDLRSQVKRTV